MVELGTGTQICVFKNALTPEFCQDVIKRFDADPRVAPGTMNYSGQHVQDDRVRKADDLRISKLPEWKDVDTVLFDTLARGMDQYKQRFPVLKPWGLQDCGYMIQRTSAGGYYHWHSDVTSLATSHRIVIGFWYLNTVEPTPDGADGMTEFKEQKVLIKPEQGNMTIFPATWTHFHRGRVTGQTKYTVITALSYTR